MSPVAHIGSKVSPALLMLGANDRRVPPSQGRRWAETLRGAGHEVETIQFGDSGHALDSFDAEWFGFEAANAFFEIHQ
jgi:acylaminoacyl-peptidase